MTISSTTHYKDDTFYSLVLKQILICETQVPPHPPSCQKHLNFRLCPNSSYALPRSLSVRMLILEIEWTFRPRPCTQNRCRRGAANVSLSQLYQFNQPPVCLGGSQMWDLGGPYQTWGSGENWLCNQTTYIVAYCIPESTHNTFLAQANHTQVVNVFGELKSLLFSKMKPEMGCAAFGVVFSSFYPVLLCYSSGRGTFGVLTCWETYI